MLPTYLHYKRYAPVLMGAVFLIALFMFPSAFAQQSNSGGLIPLTTANGIPSAQSMLVNFAEQVPNLMRLMTAIAYVMGLYFVIHGIILLKHAGEMRTQMSHEHHLTKPIAFIGVGAALIYLPTTVQVGLSTFWANPNPYGYLEMQDQWFQFINVCFLIVQFVGALAVIRGLVMLKDLGGHGGQGGMGKALTHIIGGILCINIYQFVQVIMVTLGLQAL
jgi:uncharacterized membrane protein HdeD (DUF308 family)